MYYVNFLMDKMLILVIECGNGKSKNHSCIEQPINSWQRKRHSINQQMSRTPRLTKEEERKKAEEAPNI